MAIQQFLISKLLQPLQRITAGWSDKTRDRVFVCLGLVLFFHSFLDGMRLTPYRYLFFFAIDCVLLGCMVLCTLNKDIKPVRFRLFPAICWFGIGFLMLLAGVLVTDNRLPEALLFLVVYPVIFLVWNNIDRQRIFSLLSRICILSFIPYTLINTLLYPMGVKQYAGLMLNVNGASFYLLLVFACLLVEILDARKFDRKLILHIIAFGLCVAQIYYTSSRTGYLAGILVAVTTLLMYVLLHKKEKLWLLTLGKILACALSAVVLVNTAFYLFQVSKLYPEFLSSLHLPAEDPISGDMVLNLDAISDLNDDKFSMLNKSPDRISTGRISIWKAFGAELNLLGHPDGDSYYISILGRYIHTTHNTILQFGYESGILAGILYLLFNLFTGIASIIFARRYRKERFAILPFAVTLTFGFMSLLSSLGTSFYYMITLYYYLVQFPLMVKQEDAEKPA